MIGERPARAGALLLVAGVVLVVAVLAAAALGGFSPILLPGLLVIGGALCLVGVLLVVRGLARRGSREPAPRAGDGGAPPRGPAPPGPGS